MQTDNPILTRIRKLLQLSKSGNEHEAALATERAAALMAEHEIHEAEVRLSEPSVIKTAEPIGIHKPIDRKAGKRIAWHNSLAWGVSRKFHCSYYTQSGVIVFFGRLSQIQAASYTLQFLIREVERLVDTSAPTPEHSKKFRNAFRLGCANRISKRLQADVADGGVHHQASHDRAAVAATHEAAPSDGAMVLVQQDRQEVEDAYAKMFKGRKAPPLGNVSSFSGYEAGVSAGNRANLGGSAKGGLKAGQGVLP
jgi:hypothetical protein